MYSLQTGVRDFMQAAGLSLDKFDAPQAILYTALQLEEMAEKIQVIVDGEHFEHDKAMLREFLALATTLSNQFKRRVYLGDLLRCDHRRLIDADFDLAFVSLGALYSTATNGDAAIHVGVTSNLAKFPNGTVLRDAHNKIRKPPGWMPPDFSLFVDTHRGDDS